MSTEIWVTSHDDYEWDGVECVTLSFESAVKRIDEEAEAWELRKPAPGTVRTVFSKNPDGTEGTIESNGLYYVSKRYILEDLT